MRILNLYAGLGGNREMWGDMDVTAVEMDPSVAAIYKDRFPNDKVIIADAHEFLVNHHQHYDFVWASPPCPTHSRLNTMQNKVLAYNNKSRQYPDMKLYQEIIFLDNFFDGLYCVENVIPYYEPLIKPTIKLERHLFWANFTIPKREFKSLPIYKGGSSHLQTIRNIDVSGYKGDQRKDKILRNMVNLDLGLHILNAARYAVSGVPQNGQQLAMFESVV